jgi:hypothetical protein
MSHLHQLQHYPNGDSDDIDPTQEYDVNAQAVAPIRMAVTATAHQVVPPDNEDQQHRQVNDNGAMIRLQYDDNVVSQTRRCESSELPVRTLRRDNSQTTLDSESADMVGRWVACRIHHDVRNSVQEQIISARYGCGYDESYNETDRHRVHITAEYILTVSNRRLRRSRQCVVSGGYDSESYP